MICPKCNRKHTALQIGLNMGLCPICKTDLSYNPEVMDYVIWRRKMLMWDYNQN